MTLPGDSVLLTAVQRVTDPGLTAFLKVVTQVGSPEVIVAVFVLGVVILWFIHRRRDAIVIAAFGVGNVLTYIIKHLVGRPRPTVADAHVLISEHGFGFPSGHAIAAVLAGMAIWWLWRQYRPRSGWLLVVLVAGVFLIGLSRLALGVHWPSDILGGYATGLLWAACVWWAAPKILRSVRAAP